MRKTNVILFKSLILALLALSCISSPGHASDAWQTIAAGVEYQKLEGKSVIPWSGIHVLRIDLKQTTLRLVTAKSIGLEKAFARDYVEKTRGIAAINGGFFDDLYQPLGLRINQHHQLTPLKKISWWSIFYLKNQKAYIKSLSQFHLSKDIEVAIQSGPRLLINHQIPSNLKPGHAQRSAVGITEDGHLILLSTEHNLLTTNELAHIMQSPPLNCSHALNFDGGSSSQLYVQSTKFSLNIPGFSPVSDALVINPQLSKPVIVNPSLSKTVTITPLHALMLQSEKLLHNMI